MNDPHRDVSAPTFTASHDLACDDAELLRRIGQGDEDAMAAFYREQGQVVFAQVLLVAGERVLRRSSPRSPGAPRSSRPTGRSSR